MAPLMTEMTLKMDSEIWHLEKMPTERWHCECTKEMTLRKEVIETAHTQQWWQHREMTKRRDKKDDAEKNCHNRDNFEKCTGGQSICSCPPSNIQYLVAFWHLEIVLLNPSSLFTCNWQPLNNTMMINFHPRYLKNKQPTTIWKKEPY